MNPKPKKVLVGPTKENSVMLRHAGEQDIEGIARLYIASWQATYRNVLPTRFLDRQDLRKRTDEWRIKLRMAAVTVLLAEEGGVLVGFVACGPTRDQDADWDRIWEIYNLHVSATHHRQGFGTVLFTAAGELGSKHGASDLTLWVERTNDSARRFYESKGMQPDGAQQEHDVGPGARLQEVRYRMKLACS